MNNIDEWLNSLAFDEEPQPVEESLPPAESVDLPAPVPNEEPQQPSSHELSDNDYDDILSELGFSEIQEAEVVEENEEEEEEEVENTSTEEELTQAYTADAAQSATDEFRRMEREANESPTSSTSRDLDAEEDEEWMERIQSGSITPVEDNSPAPAPLLQPNSPTLLMNDATSRFSGTEWFDEIQKQRVLIAGCGGIGSNLAFQIARMHPDAIILYDDDEVERANMSGQLFSFDDIGYSKVNAVAKKIASFTTTEHVIALPQKFEDSSETADIMMCGFDSMEARRTFFASWCNHMVNKTEEERKKCLFLDGRLSIDTLQIFCLTGDDNANILRYQDNYLFSDTEADDTVCSMKQTTYLACMIGSLMTNLFTNFVANQLNPILPYDLPFFTEYDSQNMIFKTEN